MQRFASFTAVAALLAAHLFACGDHGSRSGGESATGGTLTGGAPSSAGAATTGGQRVGTAGQGTGGVSANAGGAPGASGTTSATALSIAEGYCLDYQRCVPTEFAATYADPAACVTEQAALNAESLDPAQDPADLHCIDLFLAAYGCMFPGVPCEAFESVPGDLSPDYCGSERTAFDAECGPL